MGTPCSITFNATAVVERMRNHCRLHIVSGSVSILLLSLNISFQSLDFLEIRLDDNYCGSKVGEGVFK